MRGPTRWMKNKMNLQWYPFVFLPVHKPTGPTSHDLVDRIRRVVGKGVKVGHTGTLDPFASGVLLMAIGKATKFADFVHELPKTYRAVIRLGVETNTLDPTGEVTAEGEVPTLDQASLDRVAEAFTGRISQVPPAFSAKRVNGRKSYELARKNQAVALAPKNITIHHLKLAPLDELRLECEVGCSTGTYVRALARDIGEALGTPAHLESLERTSVGPIGLADCAAPEDLTIENLAQWSRPVSEVVPRFPEVELPYRAYTYLVDGRAFPCETPQPAEFLAVFKRDDVMGAVFRCAYNAELGQVQPKGLCYLAPDLR